MIESLENFFSISDQMIIVVVVAPAVVIVVVVVVDYYLHPQIFGIWPFEGP